MSRKNGSRNPHTTSGKVREELVSTLPARPVIAGLTEEESALMRSVVRSAPDALLTQIIRAIPVPLLILAVDEAPVRGNIKTIPEIQRRLVALQEKLAGR